MKPSRNVLIVALASMVISASSFLVNSATARMLGWYAESIGLLVAGILIICTAIFVSIRLALARKEE